MFNILLIIPMFLVTTDDVNKYEIPGLGEITLPDGEWKLEETHNTSKEGAHCYVFKKKSKIVERITITRFKNRIGDRGLTHRDCYGFCDCLADSMYEGLPDLWGQTVKRPRSEEKEYGTGYFIRLPRKSETEPLTVTNIYEVDKTNWMNHGLIASNKTYVFLFLHSSTRIVTPETIGDVCSSARLKGWPKHSDEKDDKK